MFSKKVEATVLCFKQYLLVSIILCGFVFCNIGSAHAQTPSEYISAGTTAMVAGDYQTAITDFQQAMATAPTGAYELEQAQFYLIKCYSKLNDEPDMVAEYNRLLARNANSPALDDLDYLFATYYYETKKDYATALAYFQHLIENYQDSSYIPLALFGQMRVYYNQKNHPELERVYTSLQSQYSNNAVIHTVQLLYGKSLRDNAKKYLDSLAAFQVVLDKYPKSASAPEAALEIGNTWCTDYRDNIDKIPSFSTISTKYQYVIEHYPQTKWAAQAHYMLSYILYEQGKFHQAMAIAQEILDTPEYSGYQNQLAYAQYMLGFCKYRRKQFRDAIVEYRTLINQYSQASICVDAQKEIARCYYFLGDEHTALEEAEKILVLYPDTKVAQEAVYATTVLREKMGLPQTQYAKNRINSTKHVASSAENILNPQMLCGIVALKYICDYYRIPSTIIELAQVAGTKSSGTNLYGLQQAAKVKGLEAIGLKISSYTELRQLPIPFIAHIADNHYIVITQINNKFIEYQDNSEIKQISFDSFRKLWKGIVLVLCQNNISKHNEVIKLSGQNVLTAGQMQQIYGGMLPNDNPEGCINNLKDTPSLPNNCPPCALQYGGGIDGQPTVGYNNGEDYLTVPSNTLEGGAISKIGGGTGESATSFALSYYRGRTFTTFPEVSVPLKSGFAITLSRIYGSQWSNCKYDETRPWGYNWTINYDMHIYAISGPLYIYLYNEQGEAIKLWYAYMEDGRYHSDYNSDDGATGDYTIAYHNGGYYKENATMWEMIRPNQTKYYFSKYTTDYFRLVRIQDIHDNNIYLNYNDALLTEITDSTGRSITLSYTNNKLTSITDPWNRSVNYTYDIASSNLIQISYPSGYNVYYSYDSMHRIISIRDTYSGTTDLYKYSFRDPSLDESLPYYCNQIENAYGNSYKYQQLYDWWGFSRFYILNSLSSTTIRSFEYTMDNLWDIGTFNYVETTVFHKMETGDHGGGVTGYRLIRSLNTQDILTSLFWYDENNYYKQLTASRDPAGNYSYYYYDTNSLLTTAQNPLGYLTQFSYNTAKRDLTSITDPLGNSVYFAYDSYGNRTSMTDTLGRTTRIQYNVYGFATCLISPSYETTLLYYDTYNNRTCVVDPLGHRSYYYYDTNVSRVTTIKDPDGNYTRYEYYINGLLKEVTDAKGNQTSYEYDWRNRLTKQTDAGNNYSQYWYDQFDNVTCRRDAKNQYTYYYYDWLDRMTTMRYAGGNTVQYWYDVLSNMTAMNDPNVGMVYWQYDILGQMTTQICSIGTNRYEYDLLGRRTKLTDPDGNNYYYSYDSGSNLYLLKNGFNQFTNYAVNSVGLTTQKWYENSVFTDYTYDNSNRITQIKVWRPTDDFSRPDGTDIGDARWARKAGSWHIESCQLHALSSTASAIVMDTTVLAEGLGSTVDVSFNSFTDAPNQNGFIVFAYSAYTDFYYAGAWCDGSKWAIGHYQNGNWTDLTSTSDTLESNRPYRIKLAFPTASDSYYRLYNFNHSNGWNEKVSISSTGLAFSKVGLACCTTHTHFDNYYLDSQSTTLMQFNYSYNKDGNRSQTRDMSYNTTNYFYNTLHQLTTEQRFGTNVYKYTYWYDEVGNRTTMRYNTTTTRYTYNSLNQLTQRNVGSTQYNYYYDTNGNLTTQGLVNGNSTTSFSYDTENRLTQWKNGSTTVNYTYCAFGKRVIKAYNNNTTIYLFDGINTLQEEYKASAWSNFSTNDVYTLTQGVIGQIISKRNYTNGTTDLYYHYDPIGNVMFITDCYGNITVSYVQEGFGNVLATSGSALNRYHLTTKEQDHDPETGLYYFYARWYDPVIGRFITKDPAGMIMGPNLYSYVVNNPINETDTIGQGGPIEILIAVVIVSVGGIIYYEKVYKPSHRKSNVTECATNQRFKDFDRCPNKDSSKKEYDKYLYWINQAIQDNAAGNLNNAERELRIAMDHYKIAECGKRSTINWDEVKDGSYIYYSVYPIEE